MKQKRFVIVIASLVVVLLLICGLGVAIVAAVILQGDSSGLASNRAVPTLPVPAQRPAITQPLEAPTRTNPAAVPTLAPAAPVAPLGPNDEEKALLALYERVNPSVVNIDVTQEHPGGSNVPAIEGSGSGFIIDRSGYIVTNNQVVQDATSMIVTLYDDTTAVARLIGRDVDSDLAVIKVDLPPERLVPIELGDSDQVKVGQRAVAIGNPFGFQGTMTFGIVSAIGRTIRAGPGSPFSIPQVIQTDAPINPGNSGGPLLDITGRVIGVNAQIRSEVRANSGVGFAIPVNIVKKVVPELINKGKYTWPWLGVSGGTLSPSIARASGLPVEHGAYLDRIEPNGPAAKAGLKGSTGSRTVDGRQVRVGGDVITAIDGQPVRNFDDLLTYVTMKGQVGQTVELTLVRGDREQKVQVKLEARPSTLQLP